MDDNRGSHQPPDREFAAKLPQSQINTTDISDKREATAARSINHLPFEVLFLILQYTIDIETADMHRYFPSYPPEYFRVQTPADRLVSVCKHWEKIVYDSASTSESLWSVLWLDPRNSSEQRDRKIRRLRNHQDLMRSDSLVDSKSSVNPTPLDVFLTHTTAITFSDGFARDPFFSIVLIPFTTATTPFNYTFRTLSVYYSEWRFLRYFGSSDSELITDLRRLHLEWGYKGYVWRAGLEPLSLDLDELLGGMTRLEELKLIGWESMRIPERTWLGSRRDELPLPRLWWLELSVENQVDSRAFTTLLRGAPNLEYIRLEGRIAMGSRTYHPPSDHVIVLPHLRKVHIHNRHFLPYPFVKGWIQVPGLSELVVERTNRPRRGTILRWREFLTFNPMITKLSFPSKPGYTVFLSEIPGIEELTINATGSTGDGWLRRLGDGDTKSLVSDERLPICPNLRALTLILGSKIPSTSTFEKFIRVRCIPISAEGNTTAGFRALGRVVLRFPNGDASTTAPIELAIGNGVWDNVEVEKGEHDGGTEFRLKWRYSRRDSCS